ncbi:succinyl-3-ketoacid-coenzyme a transferase [Alternaria alternata]|nr:succinyl-3-ketoacid-coenzyme a transferase [Alternaria alternata]
MENFDPSSGLVYRETTSASVSSMIPKWTSHSRGRRIDPSKHQRLTPGCDTLQSMALRCCIWNIDNMEPEALQWLRWSYASRLHDYLKLTWVEGRTEAQSAMANLSVQ